MFCSQLGKGVVSAGSRTLVRSLVVNAAFRDSRGSRPRSLRSLDHRGRVLIWTVRVFVAEGEEVVGY